MNATDGIDKTLRLLLTGTTTLMVIAAVLAFGQHFYPLIVLLSIVLIITYILVGPVNAMEQGIRWLSLKFRSLPNVNRLARKSPQANPRILAVLLVFFAFSLTLTIAGFRFLPVLSKEVIDFGSTLGTHLSEWSEMAIDWSDEHVGKGMLKRVFKGDIEQAKKEGIVPRSVPIDRETTVEEKEVIKDSVMETTINQASRVLQNFLEALMPNFVALITGTLNGFIYFLAGLLLTFFFLVDGFHLKQSMVSVLPRDAQETASCLLKSFHNVMFAFIKGQVLLGILTGCYMFVVFLIFGVPYAFLLGVAFAAAELLPVVGTYVGLAITFAVILMTMPPITLLWVWMCSYAYQTIKDNILAPKVVGEVMGLHPMVVIVSLLVCAKMMGLIGILIALPLASVLNVIWRFLLNKDSLEKAACEADQPTQSETGGEPA